MISFEIDYELSKFTPPLITDFPAKKAIHVMLDSGANVSFVTMTLLTALDLVRHIAPAGQLAMQADGETKLKVQGEFHMIVTRKTSKNEVLQFPFHALVVNKLNNCDVIGGMNFLVENQIDLLVSKRKIKVQDKYYLEETPSMMTSNLSLQAGHRSDNYLSFKVPERCDSPSQDRSFYTQKELVIQPKSEPRFKESPTKLISSKCSPLPT